jgi:hypothetical protein
MNPRMILQEIMDTLTHPAITLSEHTVDDEANVSVHFGLTKERSAFWQYQARHGRLKCIHSLLEK